MLQDYYVATFYLCQACNGNCLSLWLNPNEEKQNIVLVDFSIYITQTNFNHCNSLIFKDDFFLINTVITGLRCSS